MPFIRRVLAWLGTPTGMGVATMGSFLCALFVIVFPYLKNWASEEKIEISLPNELALSHNLGVMELTPWVIIKNVSGKKAEIESIQLLFVDRDNKASELQATSYANRDAVEGFYLPWTPITLAEGQTWSGRVKFRPPLPDSKEESYRKLRVDFGRARERNSPLLPPPVPYAKLQVKQRAPLLQEEKTELIRRAKDFFDSVFFLTKGEYQLFAVVGTTTQPISTATAYKFVVFESVLTEVKNVAEPRPTDIDAPFVVPGLLLDDDNLAISVPLTIVSRGEDAKRQYANINKSSLQRK